MHINTTAMKNFILLLALLLSITTTNGQQSNWKLSVDKKILFTGNQDATIKPVLIKAATILKAKGPATLTFTMAKPDDTWNRTFYLNNTLDKVVKQYEMKKQSGSISIPIKVLQAMAKKKEPLYIYTMSLPKDPNVAAVVRVRRILLSKIEWL